MYLYSWGLAKGNAYRCLQLFCTHMSQQNTCLGSKTVELKEMGVLSLTSIETVSYQIIAK